MTRDEYIELQEAFLMAHPKKRKSGVVSYNPPKKAKKPKKIKRPKKKKRETVNKNYLSALKKNKRGLTSKATKPEQAFKEFLNILDIDYSFQRIFTVSKRKGYIVDFYLKDYLTVVEIDGSNHAEEDQELKDDNRTQDLLNLPYIRRVTRFDNNEVLNMNINDVKKELAIRLCPFVEDLL